MERQLARELALVEQLGYESYFLTVWDVVRFARERGILCQGRGSAANSAICFALGITSIDPVRMGLLFERFLSAERGEPPDIDVDFEHERREEVIQYVYGRYGRDRAGMVCEVISYRARSAIRDVGKALGLAPDQVDRLAKLVGSHDAAGEIPAAVLEQAGLDPEGSPAVRHALRLSAEIAGFPRHLSIHVGGFVITKRPLVETVPVQPAAMAGRTVVQWDKDDLAELGLLKVDLLALGMLTALSRSLALLALHRPAPSGATVDPHPATLAAIPAEEPEVYEMISRADTIGVFQIESRAQMSLLPRLRPRCFYDLVISVAIIRPGPIQGGMVHPFLRRRDGREEVRYPYEPLRAVLERTLGIPLFQEQAMRLAVVAAGYTPGEADELRRAMTHKRSHERIEEMRGRLTAGMAAKGIPQKDADAILQQLHGFAGYGFPESHAASFALLVYASAWVKRHHPAAFAAALLDSQPMGFYAPHTLVEDAKRNGVEVRGVDVVHSAWECTLEGAEEGVAGGARGTAGAAARPRPHPRAAADRGGCGGRGPAGRPPSSRWRTWRGGRGCRGPGSRASPRQPRSVRSRRGGDPPSGRRWGCPRGTRLASSPDASRPRRRPPSRSRPRPRRWRVTTPPPASPRGPTRSPSCGRRSRPAGPGPPGSSPGCAIGRRSRWAGSSSCGSARRPRGGSPSCRWRTRPASPTWW